MRSTGSFLNLLNSKGVRLWSEDGQLRCRAAKGVLTPDLRAELAEHKEAILRLMENSVIPTMAREEDIPLSFSQLRLWFLDQLEGENAVYNMPFALQLDGPLDRRALHRSLNEMAARHESLRTTFPSQDGEPVQCIAPQVEIPLPLTDLSGLEEGARSRKVQEMADAEAQAAFDLAGGPLLRTRLLCCAEDRHVLLVTMHHIISDGWSIGVLVRELGALYGAFSAGLPSPLADLPLQYADFSLWQRERFAKGEMIRQVEYWKEALEGIPQLLQLPLDHPRPPVQTFNGDIVRFQLGKALNVALQQLSRERGATLFMTLLAGFSLVLHRLSGQEDIVVGSPIANRNRGELEGLIGFFVNTLALRVDLAGDPTFNELLERAARTARTGFAHQDLPFEQLVEVLQPPRSLSHTSIFQVMMILQNTPDADLELGSLHIQQLPSNRVTAKFDLTLTFGEGEDGLTGEIEHNRDLFEQDTMERLARQLVRVLEQAVADPELAVSSFSLLDPEEEKQRQQWNETAAAYPSRSCLHELIDEQAARTPEDTAVEFGDQILTYAELDRRSSVVANQLAALGVGPDKLVGVCLERGLNLPVALLGVLKAGGAYVPLDPAFPAERLQYMLEDSEAEVLLSESALADRFSESGCRVIRLDADVDWLSRPGRRPETHALSPENLAYVIYTSGSTGRPKGVGISHRPLVNFLNSMAKEPGFAPHDRFLSVTTISFDIAALELFLPLIRGGRVIIASREEASDGGRLQDLLRRSAATVMQATPATWQLLQLNGWRPDPNLRILCGGEAMPSELAEYLSSEGAAVWNLYGPTETTIWSSLYRFGSRRRKTQNGIEPIGRPIDNTQIHILDRNLRPVPVGVVGDLYIGGAGLARGYHKRPELTAERFIRDPFSSEPGARLYRTGDLARLAGDGQLEFLGRSDHQVKLRGFRIELGEIENELLSHPGVDGAVVTVPDDQAGEKRLVAYLVPTQPDKEEARETRASQLRQWQEVWDAAYAKREDLDPTFDISGWTSSFTGEPIPADEMREWLERSVNRILDLQPQDLLEIGVGTGMLLARIAPHCRRYLACDMSSEALARIAALKNHVPGLDGVELLQRSAHELGDLPDASFDTLVLNSVVQYFPELGYLEEVLQQALRLVRPGGAIFIGDVRDFTLIENFHAAVENFRNAGKLPSGRLKKRVAEAIAREEELFISPAFFEALGGSESFPEVTILRKEGRFDNELNRYRYDAVLRLGDIGRAPISSLLDAGETYANQPLRDRLRRRLVPELRRHLADRLPEYMLPNAYVFLEQFPLTPNRKVDRKALPAPEAAQRVASGEFVSPKGPIEEAIAHVWAELLEIDRVGSQDNFFELGGHSLLATRVISRLRETLKQELSVRQIFEFPTVSSLASRLSQEGGAVPESLLPPVRPREKTQPLPLSFAQQRLWFLDQLQGPNPSYNMPAVLEFTGSLRPDLLEEAANSLVARHEALRTIFPSSEGQPSQLILVELKLSLDIRDLAETSPDFREKELRRLACEEAERPFDLEKGPLLRLVLIRLDEDHHVLLLTMSHIISDLWSMGVLINEMAQAYNSLLEQRPPELPELPVQYGDFALWQRQQLSGATLARLTDYWERKMAGVPSCLELPTDYPRPAQPDPHGRVERFRIPADVALTLKKLADRAGASPFMVFVAAFGAFLGRLSGQDDLVIGTPVAGRNRPELEGLIGFFINTLPLRIELAEELDFTELLQQVRETSLDAFAHQNLPFESLVERLRLERDLSRTPLFQVMLSYQNAPIEEPVFTGLAVNALEQENHSAKFDLSLSLMEDQDSIRGELKYRADLFLPESMARLCTQFLTILKGIAHEPQAPIRQIALLDSDEETLIARWNATERSGAADPNLCELLDSARQRYSDRPALSWENGAIRYGHLWQMVDERAAYLQKQGLGRGDLVGLYMKRDSSQVIALLAIIQAGCAYLPLDPDLPPGRLADMVADAAPRCILTSSDLQSDVAECTAPPLAILVFPSKFPSGSLREVHCEERDPACVLYTSGSSGRPKGVVLSHGAICNYLQWSRREIPLSMDDVVLYKTPFGFDPSLWEIFATLTSGASLVIADHGLQREPEALLAVIREQRVTHLRLVPTLLKMLIETGRFQECSSLRRILCGGEVLTSALAQRLLKTLDLELYNLYGPTEACVNATFWKVEDPQGHIPIGRPIDNACIHILDALGKPVPIGAVGEIFIGGAGLAHGYRNRQGLTAERFIDNPNGPGTLYRTGDLGRYRSDGAILFEGRSDHQVKLRGFRIELEEIEAALESLPQIAEAAAAVRYGTSGEPSLIAYLVAPEEGDWSLEKLRGEVAERLPNYMIPSLFVAVEELPRSSNGKLVRHRLPTWESGRILRSHSDPGITDETEAKIAQLMAELLEVDAVGREESFFALGGHSLSATRLVSRLRSSFNLDIPLRRIFSSPSPQGLAEWIKEQRQRPPGTDHPAEGIPLKKRSRTKRIFHS